jgi:hypothetical protein
MRDERELSSSFESSIISDRLTKSNGIRKAPSGRLGALFISEILLALGAVAIHHSGLEGALFEPLPNPELGEADVRLNPHVGNDSLLYVAINRLAVNLQHAFEVFRREHLR